MRHEARLWASFSAKYTQKVFTVTLFEAKRRIILSELKPGRILDLGCGPTPFLARELAASENNAILATDFCIEMLKAARESGQPDHVAHLLADNRALPIKGDTMDTVISINSILPETRPEIDEMIREVSRVLRYSGRFLAVLPAFEMSLIARDKWRMKLEIDLVNRREYDTTGWQCFYTRQDVYELMQRHAFHNFHVQPVYFDSPDEIDHIRTVYPSLRNIPVRRLIDHPLFEHFVVAEK